MSPSQIAKIEECSEGGKELQTICDEIRAAKLDGALFKRDNWLAYAFKGHQNGLLSISELAAACHIQLYQQDRQNPLLMAKKKLVSLDDKAERQKFLNTFGRPSTPIEPDFSSLSPIEKVIIKVSAVLNRLYQALDASHASCLDGRNYLIASPAAIQIILRDLSPEYYVTLFPTFGYSRKIDYFLGQPNLRIIGIECSYLKGPAKVHEMRRETPYDLYIHDVGYHAFATSFDPFREAYDALARFFAQKSTIGTVDFRRQAYLYFLDRAFNTNIFFTHLNKDACDSSYDETMLDPCDRKEDCFFYYLLRRATLCFPKGSNDNYFTIIALFFEQYPQFLPKRAPSQKFYRYKISNNDDHSSYVQSFLRKFYPSSAEYLHKLSA